MNDNVWVTDVGLHQVFKFSHEGKLLMKLGEAKVSENDSTHFNLPTDIAITNDGSFYVTDGYGNSRVVKFSSSGDYLFEWGKKGNKEGEFNLPHAIELDEEENVYVADRENSRIQIFSSAGKFLKQWTDKSFGKINSVVFDKVKKGFVAVDYFIRDNKSERYISDIIFFDSSGNFIKKSGNNNLKKEGIKCWYHNVAVDNEENIYVTDILENTIRKFKKVSAD